MEYQNAENTLELQTKTTVCMHACSTLHFCHTNTSLVFILVWDSPAERRHARKELLGGRRLWKKRGTSDDTAPLPQHQGPVDHCRGAPKHTR